MDRPLPEDRCAPTEAAQSWQERSYAYVLVFFWVAWLWSLAFKAQAIVGIALLGLAICAQLGWQTGRLRYRWEVWRAFVLFWRKPDYALPTALFVAFLAASLCFDMEPRLQRRSIEFSALAFGVPVLLFVSRRFLVRHAELLQQAWLGLASLAAAGVLIYWTQNAQGLNVAFAQGRAMPMPTAHTRHGMLLAAAILFGLQQLIQGRLGRGYRLAVSLGVLLCLAAIHVEGARTPLMLTYIGVGLWLLRQLLRRFGPGAALGGGLLVVLSLVLAVQFVPSLAIKWAYTRYQLERLRQADAYEYSDNARLASLQVAADIVAEHPLVGSRGRLVHAMEEGYRARGIELRAFLRPHSEYLYSWTAIGVAGLLGCLAVLFGPLATRHWWTTPLLLELVVMWAVLCLLDAPLQSDLGMSIVLGSVYLAKLSFAGQGAFAK